MSQENNDVIMTVRLKREGKYFFMVDETGDIPLSSDAFYMALQDNIKAVEISGDQRLFPYEEVLEILKGICSDEFAVKTLL